MAIVLGVVAIVIAVLGLALAIDEDPYRPSSSVHFYHRESEFLIDACKSSSQTSTPIATTTSLLASDVVLLLLLVFCSSSCSFVGRHVAAAV